MAASPESTDQTRCCAAADSASVAGWESKILDQHPGMNPAAVRRGAYAAAVLSGVPAQPAQDGIR
jgi:hypothetical protein